VLCLGWGENEGAQIHLCIVFIHNAQVHYCSLTETSEMAREMQEKGDWCPEEADPYLATKRCLPGTHLCYGFSRSQGHIAAGMFKSMENLKDLIGDRTCDLPACSAVPQPTASPHTSIDWSGKGNYMDLGQCVVKNRWELMTISGN
jgi:hypothetical protein